jgi:hypothetical protein
LILSVPDKGYSNLLTLSVPDEGYSNLLTLSIPDEGYSNLLTLSVPVTERRPNVRRTDGRMDIGKY